MLASLWNHAVFIEHNLEITRRSGNHLIADFSGLAFIGSVFSGTAQGRQWFLRGVRGIEREVLAQTSADGVDYEKSIPYHRFVAEMCMDVMLLCRLHHLDFSSPARKRIERMCEFTMAYLRPDQSAPNIGDGDNGRLFRFRAREHFNDHAALLSTAAIEFERGDFKHAAGEFAEDSLWLCGTAGMEKFRAIAPQSPTNSEYFPAGGFYVFRSNAAHCIVDAGGLGKNGWGGHGHNDTFGFEYWLGDSS